MVQNNIENEALRFGVSVRSKWGYALANELGELQKIKAKFNLNGLKVSKVLGATSSELKDTNASSGKRLTASTKKRARSDNHESRVLKRTKNAIASGNNHNENTMNSTDDRGDSIDKMDENKDHNVEVINIEDTKNLKCHPEASNKDKERFRKAMLKQKRCTAPLTVA